MVRSAPEGARCQGGRPRGRVLRARRLRRGGRGARVPHLPALGRARLRAGRRADPQLPHRLVLARDARPARRGRDRAGARRRRRRGHRRRSRWRRASAPARSRVVSSDEQGGAWPATPAPTRSCARTAPGRTRPRSSPAAAWTWCSTPWAATASPTACARSREGGRLVVVGFTGGSIPEVRVNRLLLNNTRGRGSRLGRLRDGQARHEPGDRRGGEPPGGRRASCARSWARASRSSAPPRRSS